MMSSKRNLYDDLSEGTSKRRHKDSNEDPSKEPSKPKLDNLYEGPSKQPSKRKLDDNLNEGPSKPKHYDSKYRCYNSYDEPTRLSPGSREQVEQLFEKKFAYKKPENETWSLDLEPENKEENNEMYKKELSKLKIDLNNLKDKLSDKDITKWHQHTRYMHIGGVVIGELRNNIRVELCTQAWCKFYEIVSSFPIVSRNSSKLNSVHLCEAPGAFVSALNHYLSSQDVQCRWDWLATTLSPYYEGNSLNQMINDDRFIRDTLDNWYFGKDNTGNLMDSENIEGLVSEASKMNGIQLVTADGSIDCQDAPSEQENLVYKLHYYETLTTLKLLDEGGCFVLKIFTMFEEETIGLMYFLNCSFDQVNVFKPATSKPGNSEVYVVCEGYNKTSADRFQQIFSSCFKGEVQSSAILKYSESFMKEHVKCCRKFVSYQMAAIQANMDSFQQYGDIQHKLMREHCQDHYIHKFEIQRIPVEDKIIANNGSQKYSSFRIEKINEPGFRNQARPFSPHGYKSKSGSFQDRQNQSNLPWHSRLKQMELSDFDNYQLKLTCQEPINQDEIDYWKVTTGKKINRIENSTFCSSDLISRWNDLSDHVSNPCCSVPSNYKQLSDKLVDMFASNFHQASSKLPDLCCYECDPGLISELSKHETLTTKEVKKPIEIASIRNGTIFYEIVTPGSRETDDQVKKKLLMCVKNLLHYLVTGSSVILEISTCLTRYTASLIFILSRCFKKTSVNKIPSVHPLHQLLHLQVYREEVLDDVNKYFESVDFDNLTDDNLSIVEVIPLVDVMNDFRFSEFLTHINKNVLVEQINTTIESEKKLLQKNPPNQDD